MYSFDIFTDSSANLPPALAEQYGITMIPYTCILNGAERLAFEPEMPFEKTAKRFYAEMRDGAEFKTSLIPKETFKSAIAPTLAAGRDALIVTITASLSGTAAQAICARDELAAEYPDRKILVVDSANASLGEGLLVLNAAKLREAGGDVEACAEWIEDNRYLLNSQVTVDDLKYLHRNGRVSGLVAFAGNLLGLKPMLRADGSSPAKLVVYGKQKGRKKSLSEIVRAFEENVADPSSQTIAIAHADCEADALALKAAVEARGAKDVIVEYYDLCTGSHVGPGTLALFFFGKNRQAEEAGEKRRFFGKWRAPAKN